MTRRNSLFYSACMVAGLLLGGCGDHSGVAGGAGVIAACPGTAAPLPPVVPGAPSCGLVCRAELPITLTLGNAPLVDVWINDRPARMLLDTGAVRSALLTSAAARFGLGTPEARAGMLTGIGGAQSRSVVPIRSIAFGYIRLGPISADVLSMGRLSDKVAADGSPSGSDSFDGLLGADVFDKFQLDLDLPHNVVRLYQGQLCPGPLPGWAHEDGTVPFVPWTHSGHTVIGATLDGAPSTAMLDSGAGSTVVGLVAAHAHGVTDADMNSEPGIRLVGVGPALVPARIHRFASIVVGPETFTLPETEVAPLSFTRPEMVLGMDFLGTHKVWVDYAGRTVHFAHDW